MVMRNWTKLLILTAIHNKELNGELITARTVAGTRANFTVNNVRRQLTRYYKWGLLKRASDPRYFHIYTYKMTPKGEDIFLKLLNRYNNRKELSLVKRVDLIDVDRYE